MGTRNSHRLTKKRAVKKKVHRPEKSRLQSLMENIIQQKEVVDEALSVYEALTNDFNEMCETFSCEFSDASDSVSSLEQSIDCLKQLLK